MNQAGYVEIFTIRPLLAENVGNQDVLDLSGSASMPSRPSRLVAVVLTRSLNNSLSSVIASGGAAKDFRIETGMPALLPGV